MASLPRERIVQIFRPLRFVSSYVAMATPLNRFANVAFRPPAQVSTGGKRIADVAESPPRKLFADVCSFPSRGRIRRSENRADSAEAASSPNYFASLGLRSA